MQSFKQLRAFLVAGKSRPSSFPKESISLKVLLSLACHVEIAQFLCRDVFSIRFSIRSFLSEVIQSVKSLFKLMFIYFLRLGYLNVPHVYIIVGSRKKIKKKKVGY